jgi:hypothetical protein
LEEKKCSRAKNLISQLVAIRFGLNFTLQFESINLYSLFIIPIRLELYPSFVKYKLRIFSFLSREILLLSSKAESSHDEDNMVREKRFLLLLLQIERPKKIQNLLLKMKPEEKPKSYFS